MIFSDVQKRRGRLTAPERQKYATAADQLGINTSLEIGESASVALVLSNLASQSPQKAAIVADLMHKLTH
jgi:hypothetical protein